MSASNWKTLKSVLATSNVVSRKGKRPAKNSASRTNTSDYSPKHYTRLARRTLATGARALCAACSGSGLRSVIGSLGELDDLRSRPGQPIWELPPCEACSDRSQRGESPCPLHICEQCNGKGAVCPGCRGMRFIRVPHAVGNNVERCTRCCEGNQVNDVLEMRTILAYIARSQPTQPTVTPDHEVM